MWDKVYSVGDIISFSLYLTGRDLSALSFKLVFQTKHIFEFTVLLTKV